MDLDAVLGRAAPDALTLAATAYLLLPAVIFLAGWGLPPWGWAAAAVGLASLVLSPGWRGGWPLGRGATLGCFGLGLLWAGITGAHHLLYSTVDWQIRDAVLRDLSVGPWPVAYAIGEEIWLLRAPLGFYMPAAVVGRVAGFDAAQAALWAWTGLGLGLTLALLACLARDLAAPAGVRWRPAFALVAGLFVLFGGLDLLPNIWLDWAAGAGPLASWGRGGEWWARFFQYSGHVTLVMWVPNHALPGWIPALLLLRHAGAAGDGFARGSALTLAAAAFWGPLSAFGAAVLTGVAFLGRGPGSWWPTIRAAVVSPPGLLAFAFAVPICLYLTTGSTAIPHGPLLWVHPPAEALARWAIFLVVEVLVWAGFALLLVRGRILVAAIVILALLPGYVFGPGNEMTMRGGIAPLTVLAIAAAAGLMAPLPAAGAGRRAARFGRMGLAACALVAALGSLMEASPLVVRRPWSASEICSLPEAARQSVFTNTDWSHYVVGWPYPGRKGLVAKPWPRPVDPVIVARCWPEEAG